MNEFQQEEPASGEDLSDEEGLNPTRQDINGDFWETNDEPAQGEEGQDSV
jgi:hypothetical protein